MSIEIAPIELLNLGSDYPTPSTTGFLSLYFKKGWLTQLGPLGTVKDVVLDRILQGYSTASSAKELAQTDTVLEAFGRLQASLLKMNFIGDVTAYSVAYNGGFLDIELRIGYLNQSVTTTSTPTFAGIILNGPLYALGAIYKHRTSTSINYNPSALTSDYLIAVTSTGTNRSVIISTEDIATGSDDKPRYFIVKDEGGGAAANNITITLENGGTIDGAANAIISTNYGSVKLYINGSNAFIHQN